MEPVNLLEYEPLARQKLPEGSYGFIAGAAEDEVTLRENRAAFQRLRLRPRVLVDVSKIDPSTTVLGQRIEFPVLLAPVAVQRLAHPDGELASARAAAAAGTIMALSTSASCSIEEVARAAEVPRWFQLYFNRDREVTKRLVERAESHGYSALCLTVDLPWLGRREADIRNRLQFPPEVTMANFTGDEARGLLPVVTGATLDASAGPSDPSLTWKDVDWLRSLTKMRLVIKGILTAGDAALALEHGAEAIVVSNHGGRQLDGVPSGIEALTEVVEAVAGRAEVLVDGGVRRGTDVLKALALGARAVLIGRPYIWGLAVAGEEGVKRVLSILRFELELAMALAGCPAVADIGLGLIARPAAPGD
ncbi:MAG TPA: alpha-hydroxy acid oxidase [Dehalococcoidia bacterium]|nr:alpha-hydroxy acid oxidase [Dehalococcoidia bacterium]